MGPRRQDPAQHSLHGIVQSRPRPANILLLAAASGSDHYKVSVDGKQIIEQSQAEGQRPESATLDLAAGQTVNCQSPTISPASAALVSASALPMSPN